MAREMLIRRDGSLADEACILDYLGIKDAVLAWIADDKAFSKQQAATARRLTKQGVKWRFPPRIAGTPYNGGFNPPKPI